MINKAWFWKESEGFLGNDEQSKILFVMREPNSKGKEVVDGEFWFRDVVNPVNGLSTIDIRYFEILGKIACLLLGKSDKTDALKQCAYVNLYPKKGKGSRSNCYKCQLDRFLELEDEYHRWDIIESLPEKCIIVTMTDIANAIKKVKRNSIMECCDEFYLSNSDKKFLSFSFTNSLGGEIKVYSIPHPKPQNMKRDGFSESDINIGIR